MNLNFLNETSAVGLGTLVLLLVCSIVVVTVVIERLYTYKQNIINSAWLHHFVCETLRSSGVKEAYTFVQGIGGMLPRVFEAGLARAHLSQEMSDAAMETAIARERLKLESNLPIISTIAVIAPFIGLFGTVVGIMNTFDSVAAKGQAGVAVVSAGVAEALVATATGLFVAITAVVFFNYFRARVSNVVADMNGAAARLSEMLELMRQGKEFPEDLLD
ncbi:MAG: MotA/TolQ/ExbB proton channel family protein [Candidatus Bruticola sp.]